MDFTADDIGSNLEIGQINVTSHLSQAEQAFKRCLTRSKKSLTLHPMKSEILVSEEKPIFLGPKYVSCNKKGANFHKSLVTSQKVYTESSMGQLFKHF